MESTTTDKVCCLVVGGTGDFSRRALKELLSCDRLKINLLCKESNSDVCKMVTQKGGKCVTGDIMKPEDLKDCCKGIHTVICLIDGSSELFTQGQRNLLDCAVQCGVKRFVPSDFCPFLDNITSIKDYPILQAKKQFRDECVRKNNTQVKFLSFFPGVFLETFFDIQINRVCDGDRECWKKEKDHRGIAYFGDDKQKIQLTAMEDCAKVLSVCVGKPERVGDVTFCSCECSVSDICKSYQTCSKTEIKCTKQGSIEDLKKKIEEVSKSQMGGKSPKELEFLSYECILYDDKMKLPKNQMSEFESIKPVQFSEWMKRSDIC